MGFFSRLFGRKDKKVIKPVTTDEVDEAFDNSKVAAPVESDESNPDKAEADFHIEIVNVDDNVMVRATVKGDHGTRVYTKGFDTVGEASEFISTTSDRIIQWTYQGKTLYQAMGYLNMSRVRTVEF